MGAESVPTSAGEARRQVQGALDGYGRRTGRVVSTEVGYDVALAVSELVTNALRHGAGLRGFHAAVTGDLLHVEVADHNTAEPHTAVGGDALSGAGAGGLGWPIVQSVAEHLSITPNTAGKTISATFRLRFD
ncbi:ATP-binding protein [Streptomyces sp. ICBB 8177]|uniref:ATP-binding protein n=1 Tax=Streptomyces sp. ICBB 8177 TaxID=563922 RepID=UPI00316AE8D4